ncbi:hypothetical protein BsWGS_04391 [Bradybaena similaris]
MFKNIRKKLEQGVAQSKAVVTGFTRGDDSSDSATSSDSLGRPVAESTPQKDVTQVKPLAKDSNSSDTTDLQRNKIRAGISNEQLLDTSAIERSSSIGHEREAKENRSRTSSVSSMISDSTYSTNTSLSHHYTMPSDVESEAEDPTVNLSSISKEELYSLMKRLEHRAFKYKSKFMELTAGYKDVLQEKEQLKLKLQKERKEPAEELKPEAASPVSPTSADATDGNISMKDEIELLKSKIKRQDGLLHKCKETITNYKERVSELSQDKQELIDRLELVSKTTDRVTPQSPDQVSRLQSQMQEARKVIEQLESDREVAIAEFKQQVHEEMERRDAELEHAKLQCQKFVSENNNLKLEIERLTNETEDLRKINQEQLEKARNIMRRLKEDKRLAIEQAEERIRQAEQSMEEEKEKMLIDLKRGKAEAFSVMQQESEKKLAEQVEAAVLKRDQFWNQKMAAQEEAHGEVLRAKDREKEMALVTIQEEVRQKLKEKEDEVRLALEERELQKMAAVMGLDEQKDKLLLHIEELSSAKIGLTNRFSKFQEDSERQISDLKDRLNQKEAEHSRQIQELQSGHEEALAREISIVVQRTAAEIELLKQRHAEEVQSLMDMQEQELQESNEDTESYYKNQLESEKEKLESLLSVTTEQLEDMRNCYSQTQAKLKETEQLLLIAEAGQQSRKREQLQSQGKAQQSITDTADHDQRIPQLLDSEVETEYYQRIPHLLDSDTEIFEKPDSQLHQVCEDLTKELRSVREALAASELELKTLKTENTKLQEKWQQGTSQSEQERGESVSLPVQELKERTTELEEENQCLKRNVENSKIQVEELERFLQETVNDKKATECKTLELEVQVGQLQEVIRTLESCQNTVEREKASLESKLTCLENIVEDLKSSKMELNEKLHGRHEALIQQSAEEKQALESRADEFASQVDILKEELDALKKALLSKNDENVALRSVVDDNTRFIKSLESKIEKLTSELQIKSQALSQSEATLARSQEKFEKLKNEANVKVKGLKDIKDSLTEQLNQKQKECEELQHSLRFEQETLVKNYEENLSKQKIEFKDLEQTFKEQFMQKQAKFKERISKLKEHHASILLEKDKNFEDRLKEVMSLKDVDYDSLTNQLEKVKEDQLKCLEQKHQAAVDDLTTEWEIKYQTLKSSLSQELETATVHYQQQVSDLQQQLLDKDSLTQELSCARTELNSVQKELEDLKLEMVQQSEKHTSEIESITSQLAERNTHIQQLSANSETLDKSALESEEKDRLLSQIQSLTKQLSDKDTKLEIMAGTISAEQEYLHKQLSQQVKVTEVLQVEKNALSKQLEDIVGKHEAQLQEKDVLLTDIKQQLYALKQEHTTLKEILTSFSDETLGKHTDSQSLEECFRQFKEETDTKLHDLDSELEIKIKQVTSLQEEITHLKVTCEQKLADVAQNHARELDVMKSDYDFQISQLSLANSELKTEANTLKSQLSEAIESYENRLKDEQSKLEIQTILYNEEVNVLKQQVNDVQKQTGISVNKLQSMLPQNTQEKEEKHLAQSHQKDVESIKQEAEQKMKDLRQRYVTKLKEVQSQAKSTIEELENTLQIEKAAKSEMNDELTRANTRLLQLEENTGTSRNTIVDLEHKVVEMTALLKLKDNEISKLKTDMAESEKNMQEILDETETNCKQINDKLTEAEAKLKEEESNQQQVNQQLLEKLAQLQEMEAFIKTLESRCSELDKVHSLEKEKFECELQQKSNAFLVLEDLFQKTQSQLHESEQQIAEFSSNLKSALSEIVQAQAEKLSIQAEVSRLSAEQDELKSKLLEAEITLEKSLISHKSVMEELEIRLSESESQKEHIEHDYETKLNQLKLVHAAELSDLSESMKVQSSSMEAEYKNKVEGDISLIMKRFQDEQIALVDKHQKDITKLQETINILTEEISDLKLSQEQLISEHENVVQNMKCQFEQEVMLKQSVIEEYDKKQQEYIHSELNLKREIDSILSDKSVLLEKISVIEKENGDLKVQYSTESEKLIAKNNELCKNLELLQSDRDEELITLKAELADLKEELEETMHKLQKSNEAILEEQAHQQTAKMEHIVNQTNGMLVSREQEMETSCREVLEENCSTQGLVHEHQKTLNELKQEIQEKDKYIEQLRVDYHSQIQSFQSSQDKKIKELQSELASMKVSHQQEIKAVEMRFKVEAQDVQSKENADYQEFSNWTDGYDSEQNDALEHGTEDSILQQQVILLTRQIEQMKQEHRLELAEAHRKHEVGHNSLQQSLLPPPAWFNMDTLDPNFSPEVQNLELVNMNLKAQVSQLNGELRLYKTKEADLVRKIEKLEHGRKSTSDDDDTLLSLDGSFLNHTDSAAFREPTEFEYLKNILYEYMMGRETKTLAKVIATVVRFSDEQMRNVLAKADTMGRKP